MCCLVLGRYTITLRKQLPAVAETDAISEEKLNPNSIAVDEQLKKEV